MFVFSLRKKPLKLAGTFEMDLNGLKIAPGKTGIQYYHQLNKVNTEREREREKELNKKHKLQWF